jgi:hypothetical protein
MRRIIIALVFAYSAAALEVATSPVPAPRAAAAPPQRSVPERLIILADVTSSLAKDEISTTYKFVADIFRLAPEDTEIIVYPVTAEVATAQAFEGRVPSAPVPGAQRKVRAWREAKEAEALRLLQSIADSGRNQDQRYASCISVALQRAADVLRQTDSGANTDIIVISDMVEECRSSVFGGAVRFNKRDLGAFVKAASNLKAPIDFRGARVVTFFPSALTSGNPHDNRPDRESLKRIWRVLLQNSNADPKRSDVDVSFRHYLFGLEIEDAAINEAEKLPPRLQSVAVPVPPAKK